MNYLIFSVLCSVIVSVLLKIARRNQVDIKQAIAFNYVTAVTLTWFILNPALPSQADNQPWLLFLALGVLLPTIFVAMSRAVETAGIVRSDAAQRLSLFIPILASFTIFAEAISTPRLISLAVAFVALFCLLHKPIHDKEKNQYAAIFLFLVWIGYGVIDILFKQMAKTGTAFPTGLTITFTLAGILMFAYLLLTRTRFNLQSIVAGLILGLFNFGNILFYIRAHQVFKDNPTLVFTTMNIGVISLGTLVGALIFKEKISRINALGIILAIAAVYLLYFWAMR
ncbi:EamA family transporter [Pelistega suis]|uniref:EamA/RhaT family transporter n=1 Tax=Pelistega suis TaxID=1631957 RepID=A0A849P7L3_9BURK|nr:EamA family transporter [Pelistega suis]MCQ9329689.1 EamA/RhaT family transporter [Pelistega suis]NOL51993.1 EamA/RhaT family transporter [Pelistega suis]